jgi:hypothetical protein
MKIRLTFIALCVSLAFIVESCCPINPPLNSAISAHGNTDWHIDTAEEFLFGTDMSGTPTASNYCPSSWTRRHMNIGLSNTNHFYYDSDLTTPGDDTDSTSGIDTAMLFFHAGHGFPPPVWDTLGNQATQANMRLGDCPGGGLLRYYWQCSCTTFAHGPRCCPGMTCSSTHPCTGGYDWWYQCPGDFDGSADSVDMRNVYERWGPVLSQNLRMACGSSTCAYCHETQMNRIWDNYNKKGYDVADSFIDGLHGSTDVVPLCIAMGGLNVATSPLYDTTFTNQANTSGTSHYHIQYLDHFDSTPRWVMVHIPIPELLPIYILRPIPPIYIHGEILKEIKKPPLEEKEYLENAWRFIREQEWSEKNVAEPIGVRLMIESTPVEGKQEKRDQIQKNVIVKFKRQIDADGVLVNVLGEGGVMEIQLNNDGSVLHASKVWREIVDVKQRSPVKTYEAAYKEALEQLEDPRSYELERWMWGYKEEAGNVKQTELRIVFQFWFAPIDVKTMQDHPPKMVEIPGQLE